MGKQPAKKNQVRKVVRSVYGGTYLVKGRKFPIQDANVSSIAQDMVDKGYRTGAVAKWNGANYRLEMDRHYDSHTLVRMD